MINFNEKIHHRVAEVLGMEIIEEEDEESQIGYSNPFYHDRDNNDADEPEYEEMPDIPLLDENALVEAPDSALTVDNPELPPIMQEMVRIEHGQQQTEVLLNRGIKTVQQSLGEIALLPPVYKARNMEASAELFKAVSDLAKFKIEGNIKLVELKMKMAAFSRNKTTQPTLGSGNTFVFNREDVVRNLNQMVNQPPVVPDDETDDDAEES